MSTREAASVLLGELREKGFCVLGGALPADAVEACREAFWPWLMEHVAAAPEANRGPHRHHVPMPFEPPCFAPELLFCSDVLELVRAAMDDRVVADQWGCDAPIAGSTHQELHAALCKANRPTTSARTGIRSEDAAIAHEPDSSAERIRGSSASRSAMTGVAAHSGLSRPPARTRRSTTAWWSPSAPRPSVARVAQP